MHKKRLGFGIVGTGTIASHHVMCIREMENCDLVAVCSTSPERAMEASSKFEVEAYHHLDDFLKHKNLDIVVICTPSGKHMEPTLAAAKAGKHVLTEKPLDVTLERAWEMINVCRAEGVKLGCIFQNRFNPGYQKLKSAVEKGLLGKIIMGNAYIKWYRDEAYYKARSWRGSFSVDGGAALINQSIHTIDLLLDLMPDVQSVFGQVKTMVHDIEGEDIGVALLNFTNGALGSIEGGTSLYPGYSEKLEIYGENGSVILDGGHITQWNIKGVKNDENMFSDIKSGASDPMAIDYKLHLAQIEDMANAVWMDREPIVNGETALKSLELILAIYKSSEEKKLINFPLKKTS